jgi:hypothetical protein
MADQPLVVDEHGFGDHGTGAAGTDQSDDRRQQMQKQDGQITHPTIRPRSRHSEMLGTLAIRHAQAQSDRLLAEVTLRR